MQRIIHEKQEMNQDEREILLQKIAEANAKRQAAEKELDVARKKLEEYEEKTKKAEKAQYQKETTGSEENTQLEMIKKLEI